jgi:hypothetical protein
MPRLHAQSDTFFLREAMQREQQTIVATNRRNGSLSADPLKRAVYSNQPGLHLGTDSPDSANCDRLDSPSQIVDPRISPTSGLPKLYNFRHIPDGPPDLEIAGRRMTLRGPASKPLSRASSPFRRPTSPVFGSGFNWQPKGSVYNRDYEWPETHEWSAPRTNKGNPNFYGDLTRLYDREHSSHFTTFVINKDRRRKPKTSS